MVLHLLVALHEDEGSIRGQTVFALLMDVPTLVLGVLNFAVVSRHSLELKFNVASVGAANAKLVLLGVSLEQDLILDHVTVLIGRYPCRACTEDRLIILLVVTLSASHNNELVIGAGLGVGLVSELVHVIVNDLAQVNKGTLMKLESSGGSHFQPGSVHDTQVSDVELTVLRDDHELRLPEFLVVGNDVVIAVTLTDLELGLVSAELNLKVSEFVGVDRGKAENELAFLFVVGG